MEQDYRGKIDDIHRKLNRLSDKVEYIIKLLEDVHGIDELEEQRRQR